MEQPKASAEVLIGPAGWSYEDWKGRVYPDPCPAGFDALAFVAAMFPCLELNSSFYRPPSEKAAESWARRTPDGFVFTVKAWRKFTHEREGFTGADARRFQEGIAPLVAAGKLGAILLQFPWFFEDSPAARDRIRRAAGALGEGAPVAVEVRHRSWLGALEFFGEEGISFCNIDQPRSSSGITGTGFVTGPVGYVRLHGRNTAAWFSREAGRDEKYDYLYSPAELGEWVRLVRAMEADRVYVIANNHFQGKAVLNALQLRRALGEDVTIPDRLASHEHGLR